MNRKLLAFAATLAIVGAACGSASSPSPAATAAGSQPVTSASPTTAAPVTLTLWHNYGTEANAKVTDALVKAYTTANPNVTINVVSQPADNYFALLKTAAIAGSGPDLMTMWTGLFALQNQGYLEPLNSYIPTATLKKFTGIDWCSKGLSLDQGAICVTLDMQHYNGFYNKDLFAQAGITTFPTNWDEFMAASAKLKAKGILPLAYGTGGQALNAGFYPYYDLSYLMMYLPVADWQKLYSGKLPWTDPAIVAQLKKWGSLKTQGYTNSDVLTNTDSVAQFEAGKAAMTLEGSWDFKEFHDKMGDKVGVFVPPFTDTQAKGVVEFPGDGFGVTSYSKHKADAAAFLAWLVTPDAQKIIADGGLIPVVAGQAASEPLANAMLDFAAKQGYTRYPMIDNVLQPEVTDVATKVLNAILAGTMSAEDATKAMANALSQLPADRRGDTYTAPAAGG
ncbi:MAG: extracellular solute-binding protein [Chloroflexi bacterium]|nr:extracellular solute-binding protein [Chloroflexota bacterium]